MGKGAHIEGNSSELMGYLVDIDVERRRASEQGDIIGEEVKSGD